MRVRPEELVPRDPAAAPDGDESVYLPYIRALEPTGFDGSLRPFRQRALAGALRRRDFVDMFELLEVAKRSARHGGLLPSPGKETPRFYGYARVNTLAMLLSQILFVDNVIKEGILEIVDRGTATATISGLSECIASRSGADDAAVHAEDRVFYASLFLFQATFDKLFVPDENIVTYDAGTGEYRVTERYDECTAYLELSNKKVLSASAAERRLCYHITTGWSEGIDRETWDKLNAYYYAAISPTTGEENLFVKNYDTLLERMLPQFSVSKIRLAEELLRGRREALKVLEIGAGSGAFAIDLAMACKRLGLPIEAVEYHGIEPSRYMRESFRANVQRKIGGTELPAAWKLVSGTLEGVEQAPDDFLDPQGATVLVFSFSLHHCFAGSVESFFRSRRIRELAQEAFVLEGIWEHGWVKPYYMWVDCESPENFENVLAKGDWSSRTLWTEPSRPLEGHCVTNAWSCLRKLT